MFGLKGIASKLGIKGLGRISVGPEKRPIPLFEIHDKALIRRFMNNTAFPVSGISVYPIGIFVSAKGDYASLLKHECFHFEEQSKRGIVCWLIAYYAEIVAFSLKYGSFKQAYLHSSYERRAVDWSKSQVT
jgi:hypothetical protein